MKRQKKRLLGFLGLSLVAAMTCIATAIPGPETSAITSVTDTIQVRVVSSVPNVKFKEPDKNIVTTEPSRTILVTYENVDSVRIELEYKRADDSTQEYEFANYTNLNYEAGERGTNVNLGNYGYGEFVFSLYGTGAEGSEVEFDEVMIKYVPIIVGPVVQDEDEDGKVIARVEEYDDNVETVDIYIDGKLVKTVPKDELDGEIEIPMDGYESGDYTVTFIARNGDGEQLYKPTEKPLEYEEDIYVPDTSYTGQFFEGLNISKEDYLITGLLIFFIFGVVAFGIVARGGRKTKNHNKKKR